MAKTIGVTEARSNFSAIVNAVLSEKDTYVVSNQGKPAVAVIPAELLPVLEAAQESQRQQAVARVRRFVAGQSPEIDKADIDQLNENEFLDFMNVLVHAARTVPDAE